MIEKIQHSTLTGDLCHEPKGADKAVSGTVYIADGKGSGAFESLPLSFVSFTREPVSSLAPITIDDSITINSDKLVPDTNQVLDTIGFSLNFQDINNINKNFKELAKYTDNANKQIEEIKEAIENLELKLNQVILALQTAGVING